MKELISRYQQQNSVFLLTEINNSFEDKYLAIREIENRIYPDKVVSILPDWEDKNHPHAHEWIKRRASADRFKRLLKSKKKPLSILDIGCGNGWFTHLLSTMGGVDILGLDINMHELEQAARLFTNENCRFAYGDIFQIELSDWNYDIIVFNSSIQYFPNVSQLLDYIKEGLNENGEIHIMDSPVYDESELSQARKRSENYYKSMDLQFDPEYHFQTWQSLSAYSLKLLYDPKKLTNRLLGKFNRNYMPFPWILINQK